MQSKFHIFSAYRRNVELWDPYIRENKLQYKAQVSNILLMELNRSADLGGGRDRRERFVSLAEARTSKALQAIRLIGNLSNRSNYQYSDHDVNQIIRALNQEISDLRKRFKSDEPGKGPIFKIQ